MKQIFIFSILCIGFLSGCASLRKSEFREVSSVIHQRTGFEVKRLAKKERKKAQMSEVTIEEKMPVETAVKIALLHNPEVQALYEDLGIAKADLAQATLFKNPTFEGHARVPDHDGGTNVELVIVQDFMHVLLMPFQRRVAASEFERVKLVVMDALISLVAEVKAAYYEAQGAEQIKHTRQTFLEAAEASSELAERLYKAGNINAIDAGFERAAYEEAKIAFVQSEAEARVAREPLNRLLGLKNKESDAWMVSDSLPAVPEKEPRFENLGEFALENRLDYAAVKKQTEVFKRTLLATRLGIIGEAEAGFNTEKEPDGGRVSGPMWNNVEIPVYDWKQAASARVKAQIQQSQFKVSAFEVQVLSEVREAIAKLVAYRQMAENYKKNVLPVREKLVNDFQKQYNYMLEGTFELLRTKQDAVEAARDYIETLKNYWTARAQLERAVGGKLPEAQTPETPEPQMPSAPSQAGAQPQAMPISHQHHHGGGNQ